MQQMYFDRFLEIDCMEGGDISPVVEKLEKIGESFGIDFILSVSLDESELPDGLKSKIMVSL